jgi:hypothetical protein
MTALISGSQNSVGTGKFGKTEFTSLMIKVDDSIFSLTGTLTGTVTFTAFFALLCFSEKAFAFFASSWFFFGLHHSLQASLLDLFISSHFSLSLSKLHFMKLNAIFSTHHISTVTPQL